MADGKGSKRKGVDQPHDEKKKLKGDEDQDKEQDFLSNIKNARLNVCKSVEEFKYNKKRVRIISRCEEFPDACDGIVYWMSRDQRVQDNWAFLYAQKLALKMQVTLHVCFCLVPMFLDANIRHYGFMLKGLQEVEEDLLEESWREVEQQSSCKRSPLSMRECRSLGISFNLLIGYAKDVLPDYVKKNKIGGVVTDFSPLRLPLQWVKDVGDALPKSVPFCQVDAHNIVPCWETSPKLEYGARTIRNKIHDKLSQFLTEFPPVISHPHKAKSESEPLDWKAAEVSLQVDRSISEVTWAKPGTIGGLLMLESFCKERLKYFASDRNNPNKNALSNLSPWIHFGQISVQRCILMVRMYRGRFKDGVEAFVEEAVVRRELADNFCYYNENYDKVEGAYDWARKTLKDHEKDKRPYLYTREQLEKAKTHDDLWNSAQIQMVLEGKMHGFLRMYWAKKILEWTKTPQEALEISIYLNDKYNLDGRDPNGYVGCMWSICGIHDQGWAEREVFGKIRYMNYAGCKRKFDVSLFERKYKNNNSDLIEKHKEG